MQLVAYGAQDVYLSGNPQITFFKIVYRRHTNFAMESIEQVFNGQADFGKKVTATVSRNGDLVSRVFLRVELPDVIVPAMAGTQSSVQFRWLNWIGHALIDYVEVEIGGQRIDRHYGDWLHIWAELTQTAGHQIGYANMCGNIPSLTSVVNATAASKTMAGEILWIPLEFWFCTNPGLALPLIALQYHEVKINLSLNAASACYWAGETITPALSTATPSTRMSAVNVGSLKSASLFIDYVYLDTDERRRFAQAAHEYLITQLQFTGAESTNQGTYKSRLNLNHPVKEIIWVVQPEDYTNNADSTQPLYGKQWFNYTDAVDVSYAQTFSAALASLVNIDAVPGVAAGGANGVFLPAFFDGGANPIQTAKIQLNGHDRFSERDGRYFNLVVPYMCHENVPSKGINVYSFALKPEELQPSGSCNMSRIDNATLSIALTDNTWKTGGTTRNASLRVYAVNYNVLRIMSGMGGLAYSD